MAIQINDDLLRQLGLGTLGQDEKAKLLKQIYDTLEMRVGMKLAEQMTDQQLDEFESFVNTNDEQGAFRWLESNFPNYKDVVAAEFETLKNEIGQAAPQILQASQQTAMQVNAAQQPIVNPTPTTQQPQPQYQQQRPPQQPYYPSQPQQPLNGTTMPQYAPPVQPQYQQPPAPGQQYQQQYPQPPSMQPPQYN